MKKFLCPSCNNTEMKKEDTITARCGRCGAKMRDTERLGIDKGEIENKSLKKIWVCTNCSAKKKKSEDYEDVLCHTCEVEMEERSEYSERDRVNTSSKSEGYVYVPVNSANPDLVKIGMTSREPEERAEELNNSTGVAMPYIVAYEAETPYPRKVESAVHERLSDKRVNPDREFFRIDLKEAIEVIEQEL
jgi:ribosomal protein L37AE/L43A